MIVKQHFTVFIIYIALFTVCSVNCYAQNDAHGNQRSIKPLPPMEPYNNVLDKAPTPHSDISIIAPSLLTRKWYGAITMPDGKKQELTLEYDNNVFYMNIGDSREVISSSGGYNKHYANTVISNLNIDKKNGDITFYTNSKGQESKKIFFKGKLMGDYIDGVVTDSANNIATWSLKSNKPHLMINRQSLQNNQQPQYQFDPSNDRQYNNKYENNNNSSLSEINNVLDKFKFNFNSPPVETKNIPAINLKTSEDNIVNRVNTNNTTTIIKNDKKYGLELDKKFGFEAVPEKINPD